QGWDAEITDRLDPAQPPADLDHLLVRVGRVSPGAERDRGRPGGMQQAADRHLHACFKPALQMPGKGEQSPAMWGAFLPQLTGQNVAGSMPDPVEGVMDGRWVVPEADPWPGMWLGIVAQVTRASAPGELLLDEALEHHPAGHVQGGQGVHGITPPAAVGVRQPLAAHVDLPPGPRPPRGTRE